MPTGDVHDCCLADQWLPRDTALEFNSVTFVSIKALQRYSMRLLSMLILRSVVQRVRALVVLILTGARCKLIR